LGEVNGIVSELNGNIVAQHLATDAQVGYLIMDIGIQDAEEATRRIGKLKTSLKTKML
jgi:D-3-phosphoglycerate dehydrogenase